jgi:hypothetical protein
LEVVLTKPRESEIHMEGTMLVIDIAKESSMAEVPSSGMAQEPVSEVQPVPPQPTVTEEPVVIDSLPSASKVTQIRTVSDPQGVKVIIEGDGILKQEDPGISESGNRASLGNQMASSAGECIARARPTQQPYPKTIQKPLERKLWWLWYWSIPYVPNNDK